MSLISFREHYLPCRHFFYINENDNADARLYSFYCFRDLRQRLHLRIDGYNIIFIIIRVHRNLR